MSDPEDIFTDPRTASRVTFRAFLAAMARRQLAVAVGATVLIVGLGLIFSHIERVDARERALRKVGLSTKMCDAAARSLQRRTNGGPPSAQDPVQVYLLSYLDRCHLP